MSKEEKHILEQQMERVAIRKAKQAASTIKKEAREAKKNRKKKEAEQKRGSRVDSFLSTSSVNIFAVICMVTGMNMVMVFIDQFHPMVLKISVVVAMIDAIIVFFCWLDHRSWIGRLPYDVEGYGFISGNYTYERLWEPLVSLSIVIEFEGPYEPKIVQAAFSLLGANVESATEELQGKLHFGPFSETEGRGAVTRLTFQHGTIQKWMRNELRQLHKSYPILRVIFKAHYSGGVRLKDNDYATVD